MKYLTASLVLDNNRNFRLFQMKSIRFQLIEAQFEHCACINVCVEIQTLMHWLYGGVQSLWSRDISFLGHFGPWAWLVCTILVGGCML